MKREKTVIIGAGVSGITTGLVLQLLGYPTKIYTKERVGDFYRQGDPEFASRYPAASIIPHTVFTDQLELLFMQSQNIFYQLRRESFRGLALHKHYEVFEFEREPPSYLDWMFKVRGLEEQNDLPMRKGTDHLYGWVFDCFFTDWPVYYPRLTELYLKAGGEIEKREIRSGDIAELPSDIVINCSGLGSCRLFEDDAPHELGRGHLLHVKEAPVYRNEEGVILSYNYTPEAGIYSDDDGYPVDVYWYPRRDGWILGGSRQFGTIDEAGDWNGNKDVGESYERNGVTYPRQIWDLNKEILEQSYGLDLETFQSVTALKGYRYIRRRTNGLRLESEETKGKFVVHNYGHGGAGITLSWGAALQVAEMTADIYPSPGNSITGKEERPAILQKLQEIISNEISNER